MIRPRPVLFGIAILLIGVLSATAGCTQQAEPAPTLQATETPEAAPTSEPTDRSVLPPDVPTDTPTSAPAVLPADTSEPVSTPQLVATTDTVPTSPSLDLPFDCASLLPTNTPDPKPPEDGLGMFSDSWEVSSFEEAECYTDYPIAVPTSLPDEVIQSETLAVYKSGTSRFEDRYVGQYWYIPGEPSYGFRLEQHSWKFGIGNGEPAVIDGIVGERVLLPAQPPEFPPLLVFLWEEDGYWFTISGYLHGPITEEFLLKVAASLQFPEEVSS